MSDVTDEEVSELVRRFAVSHKAITDYCKANKRPRGTAGKIPCPVCHAGELSFSRASYNGHIWAKCSTPDCVQWMQ